jgi:hypothetical protein
VRLKVVSPLEVEGETQGELLGLGLRDNALKAEPGREGRGHVVVDSVLESSIDGALVVDLELAGGVGVESVPEAEAGVDVAGGPVEAELGAHGLVLGRRVVHQQEEPSEGEGLLLGGLVADAKEGAGSGLPVQAPVELVERVALQVQNCIGAEHEVV